jgi:hypothetical protein
VEQIPPWVHWAVLVAMLGVLVAQAVSGFDRPQEVVTGCLAAGAAAWAGWALWNLRKSGRAGQG